MCCWRWNSGFAWWVRWLGGSACVVDGGIVGLLGGLGGSTCVVEDGLVGFFFFGF